MESLKENQEICQPDARQRGFTVLDLDSPNGWRSLTLKDFFDDAESIKLHEGVPEEVRSHFQTARNLIIYSWFYYPFNVTAELCAYTSVEFALRRKAGSTKGRPSFRKLLKMAVAENWISDAGFPHVCLKHEYIQSYNAESPPEFQQPQSPLAQEYCKTLIRAMPNLRNSLAHGHPFLHPSGAATVRICAELINQLFVKQELPS
jgi:HEPN domain-containing protein